MHVATYLTGNACRFSLMYTDGRILREHWALTFSVQFIRQLLDSL